jgi:DNA-damage-inducible protein J
MTTIQIRIDETTKRKAKKVFNKMGLDVSSGIKLYLAQIVRDDALPFTPGEPLVPTARLQKILEQAEREWEKGRMHGPFRGAGDLLKSLHS